MHITVAILLALYGVVHLVGFRSAFWPTPIDLGKRSYLGRKIHGLAWLLLALAFVGSAALLLAHQASWTTMLLWSAGGSALMCLLNWPESRIGLVIDIVLLVLVFLLSPANASKMVQVVRSDLIAAANRVGVNQRAEMRCAPTPSLAIRE